MVKSEVIDAIEDVVREPQPTEVLTSKQVRDVWFVLERLNQRVLGKFDEHGIQMHLPDTWALIITEEVGEMSKAILTGESKFQYEEELADIAVAAICALVESRHWKRKGGDGG